MALPDRGALPPGRHGVLRSVLDDPPQVHPMAGAGPLGVWDIGEDCYRLLAEHVGPGTRTLETGCGVSTVLFAALGAEHVCCTPGPEERERLLTHCNGRGIPVDRLEFRLGSSHETLPGLAGERRQFDLFLVDGGHGFPLPIVDWFYGASMLRPGGLLVVDDIGLPAVRTLVGYLDRDPRWPLVARGSKWVAYRRDGEGSFAEDWTAQPFHRTRADVVRRSGLRWYRRGRRVLRRLARARRGD